MAATPVPAFSDGAAKSEAVPVCAHFAVACVIAVKLRVGGQAAGPVKKRWLVVADYYLDF